MQRIIIGTSRVLAIISALSVVVLMLAITLDVVVRTATRSSVPGMIELAESCLVIAVFFGIALAGVRGEHVAVTLVADRLGARMNRVFDLVVWGLSSVFLVWMVFATIERALDATEKGEERFGLIRWPLWPLRWVIVVGLIALLLVAVLNLVRTIAGREPVGAASELELVEQQEAQLELEAEVSDETGPAAELTATHEPKAVHEPRATDETGRTDA